MFCIRTWKHLSLFRPKAHLCNSPVSSKDSKDFLGRNTKTKQAYMMFSQLFQHWVQRSVFRKLEFILLPAFPGGLAWHSDVKHLWDSVPPLSSWLCSLKTQCGPPSFSCCYKQRMRAFLPCCLGAIPHCSGPFSKAEHPHLLSSSSKGTILCFFWLHFFCSIDLDAFMMDLPGLCSLSKIEVSREFIEGRKGLLGCLCSWPSRCSLGSSWGQWGAGAAA